MAVEDLYPAYNWDDTGSGNWDNTSGGYNIKPKKTSEISGKTDEKKEKYKVHEPVNNYKDWEEALNKGKVPYMTNSSEDIDEKDYKKDTKKERKDSESGKSSKVHEPVNNYKKWEEVMKKGKIPIMQNGAVENSKTNIENDVRNTKEELFNNSKTASCNNKDEYADFEIRSVADKIKEIDENYKNLYAEVEFYKEKGDGRLETAEAQDAFNRFREYDEKIREEYVKLKKKFKEEGATCSSSSEKETKTESECTDIKAYEEKLTKRKENSKGAIEPENNYRICINGINDVKRLTAKNNNEYFDEERYHEKLALVAGKPWRDYGVGKTDYNIIKKEIPSLFEDYTLENLERYIDEVEKNSINMRSR
ncbi:MAG: hypothetical protein KAU95_02185, partial [Candidatus Aenigmarchaeota archaeon]|nr:hypothetical protein [Candidatus Aenigmarchaeota archaeon]